MSQDNREPLVFVHRSCQNFFRFAARQAIMTNPHATVWHIGDTRIREIPELQFEPLTNHLDAIRELEDVYIHYSPNPIDFELFCMQRWIAVLSLMKRENLESAWVLDSDAMVYSRLSELSDFQALGDGMSINSVSPHFTYIRSRASLEKFCREMIDCYRTDDPAAILKGVSMSLGMHAWGVSDMSFFYYFAKQHPGELGDNSLVVNGAMFDNSLRQVQGCEMENGLKKITWIDQCPHATSAETGELIKLHGIHFQGGLKPLMPDYATDPSLPRRRITTQVAEVYNRIQRHYRRKRIKQAYAERRSILPAEAA